MLKILIISKSEEYPLLLENFYKGSDVELMKTTSMDDLEDLVLDFIPTVIICDQKFGSISIVQIKKIVDKLQPNNILVGLGDCFGAKDLDTLIDAGIREFFCYGTDIRLIDMRIRALIKTPSLHVASDDKVLYSDNEDIQINLSQNTLFQHGKPVHVTQLEFNLIIFFLENKNTLLKREDIVQKIWHETADQISEVNLRKVDSFVKKLRHKLDNLQSIKSVRGLGYRWEE